MMWMPLRASKMNCFIFGFQRRVWCPKWTPASSSSFRPTCCIRPFSRLGPIYAPVSFSPARRPTPQHFGRGGSPAPRLALRELEPLPSFRTTRLLALDLARVPREQALLAQTRPELGVVLRERARQAHPDRVRLSGQTTTA